jgi:hypothetical protein
MSRFVAAALEHELARLGQTYAEATEGLDPIPDPPVLVQLLRAWNDLTPQQRLAWEAAALQENLREEGQAPVN